MLKEQCQSHSYPCKLFTEMGKNGCKHKNKSTTNTKTLCGSTDGRD